MNDDKDRRDLLDEAEPDEQPGSGSEALVEAPDSAVQRLEGQVAELQDRHLRLAAEYDNYRKRTAKERTESWHKAQVDLLAKLIDALDDLARFAQVDPSRTDAKTIYEGMTLVERKLWKELETAGVRRIDEVGVPFDPQLHEAVSTRPAEKPKQDHTVGAILQPGYKLGQTLVRPARVQVLTWGGEGT